jgi:hypothetical protein
MSGQGGLSIPPLPQEMLQVLLRDPPLAAEPESGKLFAIDPPAHCLGRHLALFGDVLDRA